MLSRVFSVFLVTPLLYHAQAQSGAISVGPLLGCDITTFSCPGVDGCCTIDGCCGSGCCANGYTCINEGTLDEACCPTSDSTKCGTAASPSNSDSSSSSGSHTCTGISNCRDSSGSTWTCLLGQTCGFSYRDCNPCPYIGGDSDPSSTFSSTPTSSSSSTFPSSSLGASVSSSSPSASGSSTPLPGGCSGGARPAIYWLATVGLVVTWLL
ncbi:hypothetical protein F5Y08DRAFT_320220 [Xylaria arbuscula]|nr:hypothetical protein F5Y08DRAFT_320220 [Xylaria arbuscula]